MNSSWLEEYWRAHKYNDGFGHNIEFDFLTKFKKLEAIGGIIHIVDYYSIDVNFSIFGNREAILLFIITELPGCSTADYDKTTDTLHLRWHF